MKKQYYAVRVGRKPGIYRTWEECKDQVLGYANAQYKGFATIEEAEMYMRGARSVRTSGADPSKNKPSTPRPSPSPGESKKKRVTGLSGNEIKTSEAPMPPKPVDALKQVVIYTDGACLGNPGPGGYGVVMIFGKQRKELSRGYRLTTNNRMEILACIIGLRELKEPSSVALYSDSQYVINTMTKGWAQRWKKNNWKRGEEDVRNPDLWLQMLELCERHHVKFNWVRGHSGNKENERCDQLARGAALGIELAIDSVYESKR